MNVIDRWESCEVSAEQGFASYDDFKIKADSISYCGSDRVMPLLEEEQVLMCRLMLDKLKPSDLVLDVGTGSGVLGLWAARKCGCRVIGIDISERALSFANTNATRNGVGIANNFNDLTNGEIHFIHISFEDFVQVYPTLSGKFDVVLLNPPFTPTCPIVSPALHASAGLDAQKPFKSQIKLVPGVMRVGGCCIGYQMSYDVQADKVQALDVIRMAYGNKCLISFANVLNDSLSIDADYFLRNQYASFFAQPGNIRSTVEKYIKEVAGKGQCFSLIYYEVQKEEVVSSESPTKINIAGLPNKGWTDRIWLHQRIVENTSEARSVSESSIIHTAVQNKL